MKEITDYGKVFETLVQKTQDYLIQNNIKAQILGISGGIDSTVVAAICHEVTKRTGIPLIGRSLPTTFNKKEETTTADLVGNAFCDDYKVASVQNWYTEISDELFYTEKTPRKIVCNGNIQARLRMIYLYDLAGNNGGLVMDTDNLTENNLGYFTIHGDVGDFNPIGGLWKTEVFELAAWLVSDYYKQYTFNNPEKDSKVFAKTQAIMESLKLKPTAGLGITNNDLEEIGAESYEQVDRVLQYLTDETVPVSIVEDIPDEIFDAIIKRYNSSKFKRKQLPIKITRDEILL